MQLQAMYLLILRSNDQHLWSVDIGISISLIVEISIFCCWKLHRWDNCKPCLLHVLRMRMCVVHFMCWLVKDGLHGSPMLVCMWPWSQPFVGNDCALHLSVCLTSHTNILWWKIAHMVCGTTACSILCVCRWCSPENTLLANASERNFNDQIRWSQRSERSCCRFQRWEMLICRCQCRHNLLFNYQIQCYVNL